MIASLLDAVPGAREAVWSWKRRLGRLEPYSGRWSRAARYLAELDASGAADGPPSRRVLSFAFQPGCIGLALMAAVGVASRGCAVDFVYQDGDDTLPDPRRLRRFETWSAATGAVPPAHPRIRFLNLASLPPGALSAEQREAARRVARSDVCYLTRREDASPERSPKYLRLFLERERRDADVIARLDGLIAAGACDSMLLLNGKVLQFGAAFEAARLRGLTCVTYDLGERGGTLLVSRGACVLDHDLAERWERDAPHRPDAGRERALLDALAARELPAEGDPWPSQMEPARTTAELARDLRLPPGGADALLCPNVPWDAAVIGRHRAFTTMADWIMKTVAWFAERPDRTLVVRCHPAERFDWSKSAEPVERLIARRFGKVPANVRVVPSASRLNTYGLLKGCRFGLVYASTIGLEMAARGLPVIVAGQVHYAGKGFTEEPADEAAYFAALERMVSGGRASEEATRLARSYAALYFIDRPLPFPTDPTYRWDRPTLGDMLSAEGRARYGDTFDALAGRVG